VSGSSRRVAGALGAVTLLSLTVWAADYAPGRPAPPGASYPLAAAASSNNSPVAPDNDARRGQTLYSTYCALCHQANGEGVAGAFPPLRGSAVVNRTDATKHIAVVLGGLQGARVSGVTYANPMPAFAGILSDADIAAIVDYERGAWGNHGRLVNPAEVANERARLK
jgi:cytochrome c oxidase cbb3-type subunit II